jgi:hypothetical protein
MIKINPQTPYRLVMNEGSRQLFRMPSCDEPPPGFALVESVRGENVYDDDGRLKLKYISCARMVGVCRHERDWSGLKSTPAHDTVITHWATAIFCENCNQWLHVTWPIGQEFHTCQTCQTAIPLPNHAFDGPLRKDETSIITGEKLRNYA